MALAISARATPSSFRFRYGVSTNPSNEEASYWLCLLHPLLIVTATYNSTANPAVGHGPSSALTVSVIAAGTVFTGPLVGGGSVTGVTPLTISIE